MLLIVCQISNVCMWGNILSVPGKLRGFVLSCTEYLDPLETEFHALPTELAGHRIPFERGMWAKDILFHLKQYFFLYQLVKGVKTFSYKTGTLWGYIAWWLLLIILFVYWKVAKRVGLQSHITRKNSVTMFVNRL